MMRGWERDVWDLAVADAWNLEVLRYRHEVAAARRARLERQIGELVDLLAELTGVSSRPPRFAP